MAVIQSDTDLLKNILDNLQTPERLDAHPWVARPFVKEAVERDWYLQKERPGRQLVAALKDLFPRIMPGSPPRRGKRLDNHWGEFGLLAALYFMPLQQGLPPPSSLRDAWGRIDQSILFYVCGGNGTHLSEQERKAYRLVEGEPEAAPASTLSDWHCKGIEKLAGAIPLHEEYLQRSGAVGAEPAGVRKAWAAVRRTLLILLAVGLLAVTGFGAYQAQRIYRAALPLREDLLQLQGLRASALEPDALLKAGALLHKTRQDFDALSREARPVLGLGNWLGWVPVYGGDLAAGDELLRMADLLLASSETSYTAFQPLLTAMSGEPALKPAGAVALLNQAEPELGQARQSLDEAVRVREGLDTGRLSPRVRALIEEKLDPVLPLMDDGLALAATLPALMGAGSDGPKTYLLLAQNEDELRPTGGFITSAGNLVLYQGEVISLDFEDAGGLEDWSKPYPAAPWQLREYMNSPVLVLRDSNWFPDFPTAALWAEYLYAHTFSHSVDGVIAFDQHFLVMLLGQLGPVEVQGAPAPITAQNVIEYMRQAKTPPPGEPVPAGWDRKEFIGKIASAVMTRLTDGSNGDWQETARLFARALAERHLLVQFDDPLVTSLLAERGWDNAVRPGAGDFLLVTDTNVGFNKTNAVVSASLSYDVDLNDLTAPQGTLTVTHLNNARPDVPCLQWNDGLITDERSYPIDRCYWNYLRVYRQAGVELLEATPHTVPGEWMLLGKGVPARVDELEEEIAGAQGFGTLLVVPGGGSVTTQFTFRLPGSVLLDAGTSGEHLYRLKVQKQPGTLAEPLTIRVHLPPGATVRSVSLEGVVDRRDVLIATDLRSDVELELVFAIP